MGLDMYLTRKVYVGAEYDHRNVTGKVEIFVNGKLLPIDFNKISEIEESVGYWRKANQIHKWFVDNVQDGNDDCGHYDVSREQLRQLHDLCQRVLDSTKLVGGKIDNGTIWHAGGKTEHLVVDGQVLENIIVAEELLPSASGFFFGGTDYDEYYWQDLQHTIDILSPILANEDDEGNYYYHSSW